MLRLHSKQLNFSLISPQFDTLEIVFQSWLKARITKQDESAGKPWVIDLHNKP